MTRETDLRRAAALCRACFVLTCLLAFVLRLAVATAAIVDATVSGIRFGGGDDTARIVLDLDRPLTYKVAALRSPPRLVVDLPNVLWRVRPDPLARPRGLATGHRYGRFSADRSRLVVDISDPFEVVDAFILPPNDGSREFRLVVDLKRVMDIAPAAGPTEAALAPPAPEPTPANLPMPLEPPPPAPYSEARQPAPGTAALPPPPIAPVEPPVIVIDAGHGGVDPGAVGVGNVLEKDITLAAARELRDLLQATGRFQVVLTRDSDTYLPLRERVDVARAHDADLFLSIHADSIGNSKTHGASVYTISQNASDKEAARLAAKENRVDVLAGADLAHHDEVVAGILIDLAQRTTNNRSIEVAEILVEELGAVTTLLRKTRRFAGFVVLKSPETPSVLVELGYLSNRDDAARLRDLRHRGALVGAVAGAIERYFADTPRRLARH